MKRKVIKQGHNTFTLTLPIKWANAQGITAGSEIEVLEQGSSLIVGSNKSNGGMGAIEIDITGLPNPLLWRLISAAYRAGYDEIHINYAGMEENNELFREFSYDITDWFYKGELPKGLSKFTPLEAIQALINRFIGVEVTDQKPNCVVVKQFGEISYNEFGNALRRIFMLTISMGNDILTALEKNDRSSLRGIHMMDTNIDRFEDYCLRVLNVKGYEDYRKTPAIYTTIFTLELVGDEYKRIAQHVLSGKKYSTPYLKFLREVNDQFQAYYDLFYTPKREKALKIFETDVELCRKVEKLLAQGTDDEKEFLHHLKKISKFVISLIELAIDLKCETSFGKKINSAPLNNETTNLKQKNA
jgi:phosphate uptake regulator